MHPLKTLRRYCIFFFLFACPYYSSFAQCSPQTGAPPDASSFNSGVFSNFKWTIAADSITGKYEPAVFMSGLPSVYYVSASSSWISLSATGEHSGNRSFFYKTEFDLPCFNLCGKSYNDDNSFCLNLDLYTDNSVYEIYVNGIPQSPNLNNIIPLPDPFNPANHTQSDATTVSLCKNWKAGHNTIVIQVASSATVVGLLVQKAIHPLPPPDAHVIDATICEGEVYHFGSSDLAESGNYVQTFPIPGGCDSTVVLNLEVKPQSQSILAKTICEGQSYEGYSTSGTYITKFKAANGCDSVQTLQLDVQANPKPEFGTRNAVCEGDSIIITPGSFLSYTWQDGSTQDHYVVKKPGLYSVTVTNSCGIAKNEILIKDGLCHIYFPNAFTPNQDGKNDRFTVFTDYTLQSFQLTIYNRWGQKIFEITDQNKGWDGYANGKLQETGVFAWSCRFKKSNTTSEMKGTVVLIR